jgi:hypothetical protein
MTTTPNISRADIGLPDEAQPDDWQENSSQRFRVVHGTSRTITDRPDVILFPTAVQLGDGTIDNGDSVEPPVLYVEVQTDRGLTAVQARALSTALVNAAAQLDRWERFTPGD